MSRSSYASGDFGVRALEARPVALAALRVEHELTTPGKQWKTPVAIVGFTILGAVVVGGVYNAFLHNWGHHQNEPPHTRRFLDSSIAAKRYTPAFVVFVRPPRPQLYPNAAKGRDASDDLHRSTLRH
ncbi:unnamed protein product [Tilletia controversa]|uniref:Uncharacterized protein n=2 Tax=Tilletia TaxID=13289 RepID=A0A177V6K1_9BASI|nr:hypothetical protein CF335_g4152 [Tilletia laevis]KAE8259104.1 hypothetical protein A4X03_0g4191 [Tilletia caries]CAD6963725.1 unnamed protein product [Tilletia controversa]CAD6890157.1 unnamed protein product [Tilletia caries]CAD6897167.1 unnamed protein product [Tilletia caries]